MTYLPTTKGMPTVLSEGTLLVPYLVNLSVSSFPGIPQYPGIHAKVTLLNPLGCSSACILSNTRADLVVSFASAAISTLLPEQICILLPIMFLDKRSYVFIRNAITSA